MFLLFVLLLLDFFCQRMDGSVDVFQFRQDGLEAASHAREAVFRQKDAVQDFRQLFDSHISQQSPSSQGAHQFDQYLCFLRIVDA